MINRDDRIFLPHPLSAILKVCDSFGQSPLLQRLMNSPPSKLSDLLIQATQGSDSNFYDQVIELAETRMRLIVRRMLSDYERLRRWEESDDIFQESMIRLRKALRDVQPASSRQFFGLAMVQVRRTLIDLSRHHFGPLGEGGRHRSDPFLEQRVETSIYDRHRSQGPQCLAEWTEFHESVEKLPDEEREVFQTVYYGGATYPEAAELLGVNRRTVIRRMNRARLLLAESLYGLQSNEHS